jgi:S-adenosylmethionine:tRNA ribosyltransferase-isomerase
MARMRLEDFDFDLPAELIAQTPAQRRSDSRLLRLDGETGVTADLRFTDLPDLLTPRDVLVFNDTRVMRARLHGVKHSGGKVELLVERVLDGQHALALIRSSHAPREGTLITVAGRFTVRVLGREQDLYRLQFPEGAEVMDLLERHGEIPLPHYIQRPAGPADDSRYQTVYAREAGAVAAPTAGLHFDEAMLERLRAMGITLAFLTLHVGAGTFQPVRSGRVEEHRMHSERYWITPETAEAITRAREQGGRVVAIGTTSLRALEAAVQNGRLQPGGGETALFITPGYRFQIADCLFTNFHLPRSTLLMLVGAFAGLPHVLAAYRHAVQERYRFFSYGDAMFMTRAPAAIAAGER